MKISLRMDLSSFINTDYEKDIINKLDEIHNYVEANLNARVMKD